MNKTEREVFFKSLSTFELFIFCIGLPLWMFMGIISILVDLSIDEYATGDIFKDRRL